MKNVFLDDVLLSLESGSRPKGGALQQGDGIFSLGVEHLNNEGCFDFSKQKLIPERFYQSMKSGVITNNSILIVKDGATTGKVSFVDDKFPLKQSAINEHLFLLKVDQNKVLPKYVFYYLFSPLGQLQILQNFRGATVGGISRSFTEKINFYYPPLEEQKRIAQILDKADEIRQKRKQAIQLTEQLLKSTFLDMFGYPVINPKGWDVKPLEKLLSEPLQNGAYYEKS
jgi:type I restriction enzyme S subunit